MTLPLNRSPRVRLGPLAIAVVASALFALSYGLQYGVSNQNTYFIGAIGLLREGTYAKDWYANGPGDYHPVFAAVGWLLLRLSAEGWGVAIAMAALVTVGTTCLYLLLRELVAETIALPAFLMLVALMFVTRTNSVAASYVFSSGLQPSTVSTVLLLAALVPFVQGRWLLSGVLLGVAGVFHANFLILGIAVFGFTHLLLGHKGLLGRLLKQLGPSLLVLGFFLPMILHTTAAHDAARAEDIFFHVRAPFHYAPKGFQNDFFPFLAWQAMGLGAGAWMLRGRRGRGSRLGALVFAMIAAVWAATILTTAVDAPRVAQAYVWRYAPFIDVIAQLAVCATLARIGVERGFFRRVPKAGLAGFVAGASTLIMLEANRNKTALTLTLFAITGASLLGFLLQSAAAWLASVERRRPLVHAPWIGAGLAIGLLASTAAGAIGAIIIDRPISLKLSDGMNAEERAMYAWIQENTPIDAVFISPPNMERFRLRSERAIIADWKGSPVAPGDLIEWYKRLEAVSGRRNFRSAGEVSRGYDAMDNKRLEKLKTTYHADYAAVRASAPLSGYPVVYKNSRYKVYSLATKSAAPATDATLTK